ncbi:MAG: 3-oxoacyl-[acyl-carrier-protein] synthase III C-terminal domain-containing protein [Anaerolineales bacterium]
MLNTETTTSISFYERPGVETINIPVAGGIPVGIERVFSKQIGIGGAYGSWGKSFSNAELPSFVEHRLGRSLTEDDILNLAELGFEHRQHIPDLTDEQHLELELEVGALLLRQAMQACGWQASEVAGVLIGMSGPVSDDYVKRISQMAGIPDTALKVSIHKACDGSMGALHLALNPELSKGEQVNVAELLYGKKVLVGGVEGLSRFTSHARDKNALQLFGNGMGVIGVIPGETMKFLVGRTFENYDEEGLLQVCMYYPHTKSRADGGSMVEVIQDAPDHIRISGLMHEPEDGLPIVMAGLMGMVKLFVRTGVQVVTDVFNDYLALMERLGEKDKSIKMGIVHHANFKINALKAKHLSKVGIEFPMPWLLNDFGNVSAASNMIAFLRQLPLFNVGDHILMDGFGAGTYYDVIAVSMGNS